MPPKKCSSDFKQYVPDPVPNLLQGLTITYGSIVETILVGDQRIFYKNEDENNKTPRERWFIKRQLTKESKQKYEVKELIKINSNYGVQSGVDFFEITKKNYFGKISIYSQTENADKTTITIPKTSWLKINKNDARLREYVTLLNDKKITHLLLLSPYEFAATDTATRYNGRNEAKKKDADAKHLLETSELSNLVQLKIDFPGLPENEIQRVLNLFNNQIKMAATFLERRKKESKK
jgi:hypothetical protein